MLFKGYNLSAIKLIPREAFQVVLVVKDPPANAGDARKVGSVPGLGVSSRVSNSKPIQYFHLDNPMDRGAGQATVCRSQCWTQLKQFGTWHTSSMNFMHFMMTLENNTVNKIC